MSKPGTKSIVTILDKTNGSVVCTDALVANTFRTRLFGLLGRRTLEAGAGLLITPSSGVHTFGMSMNIDIVCLDRRRQVLEVHHNVGPWLIRGLSPRTHSVLELAPGRIAACGIRPGDELAFA